MSKIQVDSSCPSSATHHITQASTTLNRRYVRRPDNLAIEEAARKTSGITQPTSHAPSRLVNLRVSAADLEAAKLREEEERLAREAENARISQNMTVFPAMVEFGADPAAIAPVAQPMDTMVPMTTMTTMPDSIGASMPAPTMPAETTMLATPAMTPTPGPMMTSAPVDTSALAMNIAADYAAASISATANEMASIPQPTEGEDSVDAIARAASEAIAAIRTATEPDQVSAQVASLKAFADNIKANPELPEMKELGDTIDKFVSIAMKSTKVQEEVKENVVTPKVTLSSKANRAAAKVTKSSAKVMAAHSKAKVMPRNRPATAARPMSMNRASMRQPATRRRSSPQELKDRAIEQALESVATMNEPSSRTNRNRAPIRTKKKGHGLRFAVAFTCAAACVGGIIYFVSSNMPDISVRVAAIQTGIQASYPSYIPRDYTLSTIDSEDGKISMTFDGPDNSSFTLVEEKSSWDSSALLRNYVEPTWNDDYATTHEQGITIYISNANSDAAWVNGGVLYKINSSGNALTKKQVRSIVTSL